MTISIGENLKEIRQYFKMRQHDLAGATITRNLISLIENNKTPLNNKTTLILLDHMNQILTERNSKQRLSVDDLIIPGVFMAKIQAQTFIDEFLASAYELNFNLNQYLTKINSFYAKWDLPLQKHKSFFYLGEYFESQNNLDRSHLYYTIAYENAIRLTDKSHLGRVTLSLSSIELKLAYFNNVITITDILEHYAESIPKATMAQIYLHKSLAYYYQLDYDPAIDALLSCENHIDESEVNRIIYISTLKASCYIKKGMLGIANSIINQLRRDVDQTTTTQSFYINSCVLGLYVKLNDIDKASRIQHELESNLEHVTLNTIQWSEVHQNLAFVCHSKADQQGFYRYALKAIADFESLQNTTMMTQLILTILDTYEALNWTLSDKDKTELSEILHRHNYFSRHHEISSILLQLA